MIDFPCMVGSATQPNSDPTKPSSAPPAPTAPFFPFVCESMSGAAPHPRQGERGSHNSKRLPSGLARLEEDAADSKYLFHAISFSSRRRTPERSRRGRLKEL